MVARTIAARFQLSGLSTRASTEKLIERLRLGKGTDRRWLAMNPSAIDGGKCIQFFQNLIISGTAIYKFERSRNYALTANDPTSNGVFVFDLRDDVRKSSPFDPHEGGDHPGVCVRQVILVVLLRGRGSICPPH